MDKKTPWYTRITRRAIKIGFGVTALVCILLYNWTHTGGTLSAFIKPSEFGYIAAFGIEAAVVGLSLQISEARKAKKPDGFFVGTLLAVVVISAIANVSEGYQVKYGNTLVWSSMEKIDGLQLLVWLSGTGLLSLITFALAEIIGSDVTTASDKPALLRITTQQTPQAQADHAPNRPLTDVDLLKFWQAHGQANAWEQVSSIASECLNGNSPRLQAWYSDKRSIAGMAAALGMDESQAKRLGSLVRGLIKPTVA